VVDKYKSGFEPPPDIPFEELTSSTVSENHNHSNSAKTTLKNIEKMTMSGGKGKKRGGLFGIFGGSKVSKLVEEKMICCSSQSVGGWSVLVE